MNKTGLTRSKVLVIAALASVLAYLLLGQPADPDAAVAPPGDTAVIEKKESAGEASTATKSWKPAWPEIALADALDHNPFAAMKAAPAPPVAEIIQPSPPPAPAVKETQPDEEAPDDADKQAALENFRRQGVSMILKNKSKACAVVGGRLVHEGDVVDGVRIVTITSQAVIVEPAK